MAVEFILLLFIFSQTSTTLIPKTVKTFLTLTTIHQKEKKREKKKEFNYIAIFTH